ncbi:hypothetical protein [Streptomyces sp. NPDC058086]|uniref:hypothetical protein n=1 Tax=Streptomyces sp. NPDC058086 TaxID=3346334 RepID=UPI0036F0F360
MKTAGKVPAEKSAKKSAKKSAAAKTPARAAAGPHVAQAVQFVRRRRIVTTGKVTLERVYGVTDLTAGTQYPSTGREGHPPAVVVFNPGTRTGPQALKNRMNTVMELTRLVWSGSYHGAGGGYGAEEGDGYYDYADAIPLLFTTLDRLQTSGPRTAVWWRCGHGQWESLPDALANPDDHDAWYARDEQRRHQLEETEQRRHQEWAVERERWAQEPDPEPEPVPEVAPCERRGRPITGPFGYDLEFAPPEDGRHCPECRTDISQRYPTLRQGVFGRRRRSK